MAEIRLDIAEADGNLPDACMCCGQPSTVTKTRNMSWFPPWVNFLILFGLLPYAIVALILTKRARVLVPLCPDHQGHWFNRNLLMWGTFFLFGALGIGGFVVAGMLEQPGQRGDSFVGFACIGSLVLFVIWLVIVVVAQSTAIRPKEITDNEIVLQGVSEAFVEAVQDSDRHERTRRRGRRDDRADDDEYDDEPAPRKRKADSDGIQEKRRRRSEEDDAVQE